MAGYGGWVCNLATLAGYDLSISMLFKAAGMICSLCWVAGWLGVLDMLPEILC